MKGVHKRIRTVHKRAWCQDCPKTWDSANALAVAARHTAAHRHRTRGEASTQHAYAPDRTQP
ncbi:MAG: hypothetical protein NVS3B18_01610 [Candidatus Dormibacteria bacterium]